LAMFRTASRWQLLILAVAAALFIVPSAAQATPTFLTGINISDPGQDGFEPEVAVAPDGTVIAVWTRSDGSVFRIQSSSRTPTGSWSVPVTISDVGESSSGPSLAVDPSGNALAVWTQSDGTNLRIHSAYRPSGGSFGADTTVSAALQDASAPDVSMDNSGNALVAWQRSDGTQLRVQASIRSPGAGGVFGAITTLSASGQDAFEPQVAAGPAVDANGVVVWTRSDGTNLRVQSSRRRDVVGFPRPKGATPLRVSLVPAFKQCTSSNRMHGSPLVFASCAPPVQSSNLLTIGTPDTPGNGAATNFIGSVRFAVVAGNINTDADEADIKLTASITDVRNNPSLTDYVGNLQAATDVTITDNVNAPEMPEPGTVTLFKYRFPIPCVTTSSTSVGSTCTQNTTADALVPGTILENRRLNWQLGQVEVLDAGLDGNINTTGDNNPFLREGVYAP
jgi:hypothetical protein